MPQSDDTNDSLPWYERRGSTAIQSPAELDPTSDVVVCPSCSEIAWDVQSDPELVWECEACEYTWSPPEQ